jgi:hypothetical protein
MPPQTPGMIDNPICLMRACLRVCAFRHVCPGQVRPGSPPARSPEFVQVDSEHAGPTENLEVAPASTKMADELRTHF